MTEQPGNLTEITHHSPSELKTHGLEVFKVGRIQAGGLFGKDLLMGDTVKIHGTEKSVINFQACNHETCKWKKRFRPHRSIH